MAWTITRDPGEFTATAGGLLRSDPVRFTVMLTVLSTLTRLGPDAFGNEPPVLGWWMPDGEVRAAMLRTPPYPMLVTSLPGQAAHDLAEELDRRKLAPPGVNGAESDVTAFTSAWSARTGQRGTVRQRQRLFRLGSLVPPDPAPDGAARVAAVPDTELVRSWWDAFGEEAGTRESAGPLLADRLHAGQIVLWHAGGRPVSMAGRTATVEGVARVGPVYTPPGDRGRGYGAAATTAVTQHAVEQGARSVVLFTDLANPVSNRLYVRLGYQPVEDRVVMDFGRG